MTPDDVLKNIHSLSRKKGWSVQLGQTDQIRFKAPGAKSFRLNPLSALAFHLEKVPNLKWEVPGETLGLKPSEIEDFHLACDFRWFRPSLRRKLLEACGVRDDKFIEALKLMESASLKRKLETSFSHLSPEDREALETATNKRDKKQIEKILKKYR